MANAVNLNQKCFLVITGASRGIGQAMAIQCAGSVGPGSHIVLCARSETGLLQTKTMIENLKADVSVDVHPIDFSRPSIKDYESLLLKSLYGKTVDSFDLGLIIHNVGSIGNVEKRASELNDIDEWDSYYKLNLTSVVLLNNKFMEMFKSIKLVVVNITSKCGLVPFNSFTLYCSGKAAREMYFRVLAQEEADRGLIVLNYSPGPVDTDMTVYAQAKTSDPMIESYYAGIRGDKSILTPLQTTNRFLEVLRKGDYKTGDHVDYYD